MNSVISFLLILGPVAAVIGGLALAAVFFDLTYIIGKRNLDNFVLVSATITSIIYLVLAMFTDEHVSRFIIGLFWLYMAKIALDDVKVNQPRKPR